MKSKIYLQAVRRQVTFRSRKSLLKVMFTFKGDGPLRDKSIVGKIYSSDELAQQWMQLRDIEKAIADSCKELEENNENKNYIDFDRFANFASLLSYILPRNLRERVLEPYLEDLKLDVIDQRKEHPGRAGEYWVACTLSLRFIVTMLQAITIAFAEWLKQIAPAIKELFFNK